MTYHLEDGEYERVWNGGPLLPDRPERSVLMALLEQQHYLICPSVRPQTSWRPRLRPAREPLQVREEE